MKMILTMGALLTGCGGSTTDYVGTEDEVTDHVVCDTPPEIIHQDYDDPQPGGIDVIVTAQVITDAREGCELDVMVVEMYYKQETDAEFSTAVPMSIVAGTEFRGTIPGPSVGSSVMRYYFKAVDSNGSETIDPVGGDTKDIKAYSFGVE
jgi:hypothetical protein